MDKEIPSFLIIYANNDINYISSSFYASKLKIKRGI